MSGHDDAYKIWEFQGSKHVEDDAPSDFWVPYVQTNPFEPSAPIFLPIVRRPSFFCGALTCFEAVLASFPKDPQRLSMFKQPATENLGRCPSSRRCNLLPPRCCLLGALHRCPGRGSNSMLRSARLQNAHTRQVPDVVGHLTHCSWVNPHYTWSQTLHWIIALVHESIPLFY